ncbi:MAG: transcriptional regulator, GntR family [Actinomycetia bacterium]|nr:transcriptional regulator, GntR family [Actinomycetes bacterium]
MTEPPYARIATELRRRITLGELRPGDPLPSTRQIVRDFGVAMATASKALAALQQEGLARAVPGIGTVVDNPGPMPARTPRQPAPRALSRGMIVRTAILAADAQGLAALSMRRLAADLGVTTMALYRHVSSREHLVLLMADAVFGETPPADPPPGGWRRRLELAARAQWAMYRRHPWLAPAMSFTRPLLTPGAMAHTEWVMRALDGLGLDPVTMIHVHATVAAHTRGLALNLEAEQEAVAASGITDEQWMHAHATEAMRAFPLLSSIPERSLDLNTLFEFGLQRLLDGVAVLVGRAPNGAGRP